jgi:hypothetical protein
MNSLAISDALLALVAFGIVVKGESALAFRLGVGILGTAALLGMLKFSRLLPLPELHLSASLLSQAAGFPLIALAVLWPTCAESQKLKALGFSFILLIGIVVVVVEGLGLAITAYTQLVATTALLAICIMALLRRQGLALLGGGILLLGFVLFASKTQLVSFLQPGDYLHICLATGLLLLSKIVIKANPVDLSG